MKNRVIGIDVRQAAQRERLVLRLAVALTVLVGYTAVFLIYGPILWLGVMSLSEKPLTGIPGPFTLNWYQKLFGIPEWLEPLQTSLLIATVVSILCMFAATAVGRALPRMGRTGAILMLVFLIVLFIPGVVLGIDLIIYYRIYLGIHTGLWSLILGHFAWAFPFALLSVTVVSARFDSRLLEAAADLGAGPVRRFLDIELPLLLPGVLSAGFFGFLLSLNELPRSIYLRGGITTLPLFEWSQTASHTTMVPIIYALSSIITLGSFFLTIVALRLLFRRRADG